VAARVDPEVTDVIAALPCWSGAVQISPLTGGLTSRNFRVSDDPTVMLFGRETIYRNRESVGWLRSGGFGHTLRAAIGLGYVRCSQGASREYLMAGHYELVVASTRVACRTHLEPLYDPTVQRVRA
jgi:glycine cleavage system aminomethyltransferase T